MTGALVTTEDNSEVTFDTTADTEDIVTEVVLNVGLETLVALVTFFDICL